MTKRSDNAAAAADVDAIIDDEVEKQSASAQKLNICLEQNDDDTSAVTSPGCNFIINSDLFLSLVTMTGRCPDCLAVVNIF